MRILFDECVPWPMRNLLRNHFCTTVQAQGWNGVRNSELLKLAEADFDLLITADQNIVYQQNLTVRTIAILELSTNSLKQIQGSAILLQNAIDAIGPGDFVRLDLPPTR
jgi:predicted nuclease of predicted toxin-antitoxin system